MNKYQTALKEFYPFLNDGDINELLSLAQVKIVEPGEKLLNQGDINTNFHLVLNGLLRSYVITSSGEDRTVFLAKEKMRSGSFQSLLHGKPSEISIEAIEKSEVLIVNRETFNEAIKDQSNLGKLQKQAIQEMLTDASERLHFFTVLSPEERYITLRDHYPELIQRVPQKFLASYIGVTTVSLSRIKSRISNFE